METKNMRSGAEPTGSSWSDVTAILDGLPLRGIHYVVLALCFLAVLVDGFDNTIIGQVASAISIHWDATPSQLSVVFAAGLVGVATGSFLSGPIADRFGRKWMVVIPVALFGLFQMLCAEARSLNQLTLFRFLAGVGFGGAMPVAIALLAEYCPARVRAPVLNCVSLSTPLGNALAGLAASQLLDSIGWQGLMRVSGLLPLILSVLLIAFLPESVTFLVSRGRDPDTVNRLLNRLLPKETPQKLLLCVAQYHTKSGPVRLLFASSVRLGTLCLWVTSFVNLMGIYFMSSWLSLLFRMSGLSVYQSSMLTALLFGASAVGCIAFGFLMIYFQPCLLLIFSTAATGLGLIALGQSIGSLSAITCCVSVLGFAAAATGGGMNYLASIYYPPANKATGVSWMLGVGRIGSIVGALAGGKMLALKWDLAVLFATIGAPLFIATIMMFCMYCIFRTSNVKRENIDSTTSPSPLDPH